MDEKYPLYGNVVYEPIGAYERIQKEPYSILVNESLSKTLYIKINNFNITYFVKMVTFRIII